MVYHHLAPAGVAKSEEFRVFANGEEIFVRQDPRCSYDFVDFQENVYKHVHDCPAFAILCTDGPVHFEIECKRPFRDLVIRPLSAGIRWQYDGGRIVFDMDTPRKLSLEFDNNLHDPLFLLVSPMETDIPDRNDPKVHWFASGNIYDIGLMTLHSGETVYIEDGALVLGTFQAKNADHIRICGHGVLSDVKNNPKGAGNRAVWFKHCTDIRVEGITMFYTQSPRWQLVPDACKNVVIDDVNIITHAPSSDGIDIVSCEHARISNCFIKVNDDCIVVKACARDEKGVPERIDCKDVVSEKCVLWSAPHGDGVDVGFELICEEVCDIVFRDIDIIHCEHEGYQAGTAMGIHNSDDAYAHDILFEDIRVEDAQQKLIDVKVVKAIWSTTETRGKIRNVTFRNIYVVDGDMPASIIRGFESEESIFRIEYEGEGENQRFFVRRDLNGEGCVADVTIDGLYDHGKRAKNAADAKMVVEIATNVNFI